jgi:hypothetical protein
MKTYLIFIAFIFNSVFANAQLTPVEKQQIEAVTQLYNGGFENGTAGWTASGGTFTTPAYSSLALGGSLGARYGSWNSNGAAQTLTSTALLISDALGAKNAVATCLVRVPSGTATHTMSVIDGSANVLNSQTVFSSTNALPQTLNFVAPSSSGVNAIRIRFTSVDADEPITFFDGCKIIPALGFNVGHTLPQDVFSGNVGNTGTVTNENLDWINGNCTNADPRVCTFKTGIFAVAPNCSTDGLAITAVSSTTVSIDQNAVASTLTCQKQGADASYTQSSFVPNIYNWKLDLNIGGAVIDLGTADITTYTAPSNSALILTVNTSKGSYPAGISCSSTNDNTVGSTTCSAGNEQPGFVADFPFAGYVEVCFSFGHNSQTGASGQAISVFQVVRTANGSQTPLEEGGARVTSGASIATVGASNPVEVCGTFNLTAAKHTIRLMYELDATATINNNSIRADEELTRGQQDIKITAKYITQYLPNTVLVGSVTNAISTAPTREVVANLNCDSGSAITSQMGSAVTAIGNVSGGACSITLATGTFNTTPYCWVSPNAAFASVGLELSIAASSATALSVDCEDDASTACTAYDFNLLCKGTF